MRVTCHKSIKCTCAFPFAGNGNTHHTKTGSPRGKGAHVLSRLQGMETLSDLIIGDLFWSCAHVLSRSQGMETKPLQIFPLRMGYRAHVLSRLQGMETVTGYLGNRL